MDSEVAEVERVVAEGIAVEPAEEPIAAEQAPTGHVVVELAAAEVPPEATIATVEEEARRATTGPTTGSADEPLSIQHPTCTKRVSNNNEHYIAITLLLLSAYH